MEASDLRATIERLRELEAKATEGEWELGFWYWKACVNDGTHAPDWIAPLDIGHGRCAYCAREDVPCSDAVTIKGKSYHRMVEPATIDTYNDDNEVSSSIVDWHRIGSRAEQLAITGNYECEAGGVCSTPDDAALIVAARNAMPLLLRLASERLDAMESEPLELARARAEAFEEAARACGQRSSEWHSVGRNESRDEAYCCDHAIRALAAKERGA